MSDTPISEKEFLRFESNLEKVFQRQDKNMEVMSTSIKGIENILGKLTEYQIHNDGKHEKTGEEIKILTEKDVKTNERITHIEEAVTANTKVSSFWRTIGGYGSKILIGVLTTLGAIIAYAWFG